MYRSAKPSPRYVERRATERKPTALLAFVQHADGSKSACQVKNISDDGAMLEFLGAQAVVLAPTFDLVLTGAEMRYAVALVWRKERSAGVRFCLEAA